MSSKRVSSHLPTSLGPSFFFTECKKMKTLTNGPSTVLQVEAIMNPRGRLRRRRMKAANSGNNHAEHYGGVVCSPLLFARPYYFTALRKTNPVDSVWSSCWRAPKVVEFGASPHSRSLFLSMFFAYLRTVSASTWSKKPLLFFDDRTHKQQSDRRPSRPCFGPISCFYSPK